MARTPAMAMTRPLRHMRPADAEWSTRRAIAAAGLGWDYFTRSIASNDAGITPNSA
jgi:hypothetical protein